MPVGFGDKKTWTGAPLDGELTEGDEYSITITPGSESYAVYVLDGEQTFGEKGAPVTFSKAVKKATGGLSFDFFATAVRDPEEVPPPVEGRAMLSVSVKKTTIN